MHDRATCGTFRRVTRWMLGSLVLGCAATAPSAQPQPVANATSADTMGAPPYPADWIADALSDNREHSCQHLIYKSECAELRTGRVELDVTLDGRGGVSTVVARAVRISQDPEVVKACLLREVPKWRFHPPEHHAHDVVLTIGFADKC
jgi:hypothetical protein